MLVSAVMVGCGGGHDGGDGAPAAKDRGRAVVAEKRVGPRLLDITVRSPALGRTAKVRLLLPDRGAEPWPVLYLLHGCCDSYVSWTRSTDVEQLPTLRGVLVVMPEGGDVGFYSDWKDGPRWETFHTRELPAVLERYGAGERQSIAGLSMGGLGALGYAARHRDRFRAAASFSGLLHPLGAPDAILGLVEGYDANAEGLWGDPRSDRDIWAEHDPTGLVTRLRGLPMFVSSGDGRPGPLDLEGTFPDRTEAYVLRQTKAFLRRARRSGVRVRADLYGRGRHDWPYWERELHRALPMLLGE